MPLSSVRNLTLAAVVGLVFSACATAPAPKPERVTETPPAGPAATPAPAPRPVISATPRDDRPKVLARVTFAATGDVLMHDAVKQSASAIKDRDATAANDGLEGLFEYVKRDLSEPDLTFVNLETPVAPRAKNGVREFVFNSPPELLKALQAVGVDVVSFANNHVYDQGREGFVQSLDELEKAGMPFTGAGRNRELAHKGIVLEKHGIRIALIGASQFFNAKEQNVDDPKEPHANKTDDPEAMVEAVRRARQDADFVVVSVHWGVEYTPRPRESEVQLAHDLFEAGADVLLGHHPHVLQPIEVYRAQDGRSCLAIYSMGNFISNQSRQYVHGVSPEKVGDTRDGVLLRFAIEKRDYGHGVVRSELSNASYLPLWTDNDFPTRKKGEKAYIRVVVDDRALAEARAALDVLQGQLGDAKPSKEQEARLVELKKRIAMLERRKELVAARLGDELLGEPTP